MGIRNFHIIFSTLSIMLVSYFGWWSWGMYHQNQSGGYLATVILSVLGIIGLFIYMITFIKKTNLNSLVLLIISIFLLNISESFACGMCFSKNPANTDQYIALRYSMLSLLGFLAIIMTVFIYSLIQFTKRAKQATIN